MKCQDCQLAKTSGKYNCVDGWGNPEAKLVVLLDCPGDALAEKLFIWITRRLGLTGNDIWVDYIVKCPIFPKKPKKEQMRQYLSICWTSHPRDYSQAKSIVICGTWGPELTTEKKEATKKYHGRKEPITGCWIGYSFKYLLMNPAECVDAWRIFYKAAQEAGLNPQMVIDIEPFRFPSKKLIA